MIVMLMVYLKLRIKTQNISVLMITFFCLFLFFLYFKLPTYRSITQFGSIRVGGLLPSFVGISQSGKEIGLALPKGGKFYIYVIDEQLPPTCLDLECGKQAEIVLNKGGHIIGGSDPKYAKIFNVKLIKNLSLNNKISYYIKPFIEKLGWEIQVNWWKLETSLIVVINNKGKILRIYKNAKLKDIPLIMRDIGL